MFFELPEILRCPRCGPDHALVLLVQDARARRVHRGWLGCPNCGRDFVVSEGVADLRTNAGHEAAASMSAYDAPELAMKVAALSGLSGGPGYLLIDERLAHVAGDVADLLPDAEVLALESEPRAAPERPGVSRLLGGTPAVIAPYRVRAVAGVPRDAERLAALARPVAPGGRLVLFAVEESDLERLTELGLRVLAREGETLVAERREYGVG